jgi:hypothetical protein
MLFQPTQKTARLNSQLIPPTNRGVSKRKNYCDMVKKWMKSKIMGFL